MKKITFKERKRWGSWINHLVFKRSGKPFKNGLKVGFATKLVVNSYSGKPGFLLTDNSTVDCYQCRIMLLLK